MNLYQRKTYEKQRIRKDENNPKTHKIYRYLQKNKKATFKERPTH